MSFLSETDYERFLERHISAMNDATAREHVRKKFQGWGQQYRCHRLVERASELLASERERPNMLYLGCEADLDLLSYLARRHHFDDRLFRGVVVEDRLWSHIQPEWFEPFPVYRSGQWQDREGTIVFSLSLDRPFRNDRGDRGNDYLERFIDPARLSALDAIRHRFADRPVVLYADYRKVQTLAALSEQIRRQSDVGTVLLVTSAAASSRQEFDAVFEEPCCYLWPCVFDRLNPDVVHVNVGWGTQGLPFAPFLPSKAIIDFYDVLALVPDEALRGHHAEPLELTRAAEKTFLSGFEHIVHRCSEDISDSLEAIYPGRNIVSVTEYLRKPVYTAQPAECDGTIRLVYGGLLVREGADENDPHYKNFMQMVDFYCHGNLHLYFYPSPYFYGFGPAKGVEELARRLGLENIHACLPLEDNDFVREITRYDFGLCIPTPIEVRPTRYGYILPGKIIAYLRAGLPIVVPEDQTFVADLVRENEIGVVYGYDDHRRIAELLNAQDIDQLKRNVVRFRERFRIEHAAEKLLTVYDAVLNTGDSSRRRLPMVAGGTRGEAAKRMPMSSVPASCEMPVRCVDARASLKGQDAAAVSSWADLAAKLERSGFIGAVEYQERLQQEIDSTLTGQMREYVAARMQNWCQTYRISRCLSRLVELIGDLKGAPYHLYLDEAASLGLMGHLLQGLSQMGLAHPVGFISARPSSQLKAQLAPYSVASVGDIVPSGHTVISVSGGPFPGRASRVMGNDYLERFIEKRHFSRIREMLSSHAGQPIVLYPMYREIHTVSMLSKCIGRNDKRFHSISLSPKPLLNAEFDTALIEPFFYLWPLIFQIVDPDLVHMNVGWGIQALSFSPFLPDRKRTVIDFYEVLSFLPDAYFEKTHSSAAEIRLAEEHFLKNYNHVMHLCCDEISDRLAAKYDSKATIISVTEYLEEPAYNVPQRNDGEIRLVYGGCMLATTNPEDLYYKAFAKMAPYFARENLHLYLYNSPYVHGTVENDALKQVIRKLGLANIHVRKPLELQEFVKVISEYDYGATFLRPKDMGGLEYNYFMATKLQVYLRAGLPIVIDAYNRFMAGLVERYNIGIVLQDHDLENIPSILNSADLPALKRNVIKFRGEFSIEKGGRKVLDMYHEILERNGRRRVFPVGDGVSRPVEKADAQPEFSELIQSMADADGRLYYRDQSAQTMASLARYARELDPSVIVELGTLAGLSLRTWIGATERTKIYAVDLSFQKLRETLGSLPVDLSRATLLEQDILKTDFAALWTSQDKVIFFVDAHDLPQVPVMEYVLTTALPSLPDGSMVVVDDLWFSEERLTHDNARSFLENRVVGEIDELQCFEGHYAPYHAGGSFMGFAEVRPLLAFANQYGIELLHDKGSKHVRFVWKKEYLSRSGQTANPQGSEWGRVLHNPLASMPVSLALTDTMSRLSSDYRQGRLREVAERLSSLVSQNPNDPGLAYGLAVCLARAGLLAQARDVLGRLAQDTSHPRYRQLFDDLVQRVGPCQSRQPESLKAERQKPGLTIFAMPKPFTGHIGTIQKNAIRSWTQLDPVPEIILFGDEPGTREMAQEVGSRHIPDVERNKFGTPLVNKLFETAQEQASHSVVAYVNADMILFQDFIEGVHKVQTCLPKFLLIGQRWDLVVLETIDFGQPGWQTALQREMETDAMLHAECGLDYFVFRKGLYPEIPPFAIGRTAWDNWLVMAPHRYGVPVVDGTEFVTVVHQDHDYGHVAGGRREAWTGVEAARNRALAGGTDNSGRTSGATRALRRDGTLVEIQPRQPWYLTVVFRSQRSDWLLKQADRLIAAGQKELAACKWEEALVLLEALLALKQREHPQSESLDYADLARRYIASCTQLAQCYMQMGRQERVVATYTRLLENPSAQIPQVQREEIRRARDELACMPHEKRRVPETSVAPRRLHVEPPTRPTESSRASHDDNQPVSISALKAQMSNSADDRDRQNQGLADLERKYRAMSNGTHAKYAMAVRLSDLFRRAGLMEKSRALELEAAALKDMCHDRSRADGMTRTSLDHQPKITVITTCRNGEHYLAECLDSILDQTMSEWQLFLLDDGSTDGTRRIIEAYAARDARIKPFYFDDSTGPYIRRNFAITKAGTPFVMIQDADDMMCPEKLQRLYKAITEDGGFGVVGSFYRKFLDEFSGVERTEAVILPTTHEQILAVYQTQLVWDFSWHGSAIIRRDLFDEVGLYDENPFGADSFWLAKVAEYARHTERIRLQNIPEFLTLRRVHGESQTGQLPTIDPRNRRVRYWRYCLGKLREVADKAVHHPQLDLGRELRACTCGDFLQRFRTQIVEWESQPLDDRVVPHFLQDAIQRFRERQYVSCVRILRGVESMAPATPRRVAHFDLLKAMALHGLGLRERCQVCLRRAMAHHDDPVARQFYEDCIKRGGQVDVQQWYGEHAESMTLQPADVPQPAPSLMTGVTCEKARGGGGKVTVITTCRNAEPYLAECVDSVLGQTLGEWELFLLDDGSTDGTRRIIEEYARRDGRIKAHCFDDNRGPYVRRNFAIEQARADFIVIHDADDIMCPTKLEILCHEIKKDETLAMVGSNYRTFLEEYRGLEYTECNRLPLTHDEIMTRFKSWHHGMSHGSAIIRKSLFTEIGLYDENPFAADSFWSAKLALYAEAGKPVRTKNLPESLTLIRMHVANDTPLLSTLDPRNRRARYRQYCECKVRRIRDRMQSISGMDIGRELRQCTCGDFLTRFKAQIIAWESEPLGDRVIPEFLQSAVRLFNEAYYVSCVNILNGVETFEPTITDRVVGYDLLRGMAFFAVQMREQSLACLDREIQRHGNPGANGFKEDAFELSLPIDVQQWCDENAERYNLGLVASDKEVVSAEPLHGRAGAKRQAGL